MKYESGIKGTWNIIKDVISKRQVRSFFTNKITVDIEIIGSLLIAEFFFFNDIFADIDPTLASEILQLNNQYLQFINAALSLLKNITINEIEF